MNLKNITVNKAIEIIDDFLETEVKDQVKISYEFFEEWHSLKLDFSFNEKNKNNKEIKTFFVVFCNLVNNNFKKETHLIKLMEYILIDKFKIEL